MHYCNDLYDCSYGCKYGGSKYGGRMLNDTTDITAHGEKRLRKRLGISKTAVKRDFERALKDGKRHGEFKGSFKRYLDKYGAFYRSLAIVYGNTIYFTSGNRLITAWEVPSRFRKYI